MPSNLSQTTLADRYRFDERIGEGTFAHVYRVHDLKRNVDLAAKVLRADLAQDPQLVERFRREATLLERLQHPNIVRFYELVETQGILFFLLDYIPSDTLQNYLYKTGEPLTVHHALQFIRPLTAALTYAHGEGVIHRDIKPANILLGNNGGVYVTDFGIARILNESSNLTLDSALGTPLYISPEQWQGKPLTLATDVYSLGILLYLMLTGHPPFTGTNPDAKGTSITERVAYEHIHLPPPSPRQQNRTMAPAAQEVILRCLMKEPTARYASALAIYEALAESIGATPSELEPVVLGDGKPVPPSRTLPEWSKVVQKVEPEPAAPLPLETHLAPAIPSPYAPNTIPPVDISRHAPTTPHQIGNEITAIGAHPNAASLPDAIPTMPSAPIIPPTSHGYLPPKPIENTPYYPLGNTPPPPHPNTPPSLPISKPLMPPQKDNSGCIIIGGLLTLAIIIGVFCIAVLLVTLTTFGDDNSPEQTATTDSVIVERNITASVISHTSIPTATHTITPSPTPRPNERIFAYSQLQNGQLDLYEMNITTGAIQQLTSDSNFEAGPSYSPDGNQIAYYAYPTEGEPADLWLMNADGSAPRRLTNDPFDQRIVAWSPDGSQLAYHAETTRNGFEIFIYDLSSNSSRAISQNPADDLAPSWSLDGSQLAFHSDEFNDNYDLFIMNADGSARRRLTTGDSRYAFPSWSSTNEIAFHAVLGSNTYRIQMILADGSGLTTLLEGDNQRHPDWSSDGQNLLYMAGDLNNPSIFYLNLASNNAQSLVENGYYPDWRP